MLMSGKPWIFIILLPDIRLLLSVLHLKNPLYAVPTQKFLDLSSNKLLMYPLLKWEAARCDVVFPTSSYKYKPRSVPISNVRLSLERNMVFGEMILGRSGIATGM